MMSIFRLLLNLEFLEKSIFFLKNKYFSSNLFLKTSINFLSGAKIEVVSQDIHHEQKGAYTGEISAEMLFAFFLFAASNPSRIT